MTTPAKPKLRDIAKALGFDAGCGDNSCIWGSPGGMATNGGCRCGNRGGGNDRLELVRMQQVARALLEHHTLDALLNPAEPPPVAMSVGAAHNNCVTCGHPKHDHPYRHPFVEWTP